MNYTYDIAFYYEIMFASSFYYVGLFFVRVLDVLCFWNVLT